MASISHASGHPIIYADGAWRFRDTLQPVTSVQPACAACSKRPEVLEINGALRDVDSCIAPLVAALNAAGASTVASCCGHGHRPGRIALADGREVFVLPDFSTATMVDALFPPDINGRTNS